MSEELPPLRADDAVDAHPAVYSSRFQSSLSKEDWDKAEETPRPRALSPLPAMKFKFREVKDE